MERGQLIFEAALGLVDRQTYENEELRAWRGLKRHERTLDMAHISRVPSQTVSDLDKVSGRYFVAASGRDAIIHDLAHFDSDQEYQVLGQHECPSARSIISSINWYPHDTGMVTFSLASGKIMAWDLGSMQAFEALDVKNATSCHALSSSILATGSVAGLELFDFKQGAKIMALNAPRQESLLVSHWYEDKMVTALAWDTHRSGLIVSGTSRGQINHWDIRQPKQPLLITPPLSNSSTPIDRLVSIDGREGNLSNLLILCQSKVFIWSMMQASYACISPDGKTIKRFDYMDQLELPVFATSDEILLEDKVLAEIPAIDAIHMNPFRREIYVYEQSHEKLLCYR